MRVAALLLLVCRALAAQPATLEGTVVNDASGQPMAGVHVRAFSIMFEGVGDAYGAMSDQAGHFSIANIAAGSYVLLTERTGFVQLDKKASTIPFTTVVLKAGQKLTDYKLAMTPRAVIKGRVVDQYGDPVPNVQIDVEPVAKDGVSFNGIFGNGSTASDDRGEFRLSGRPGSYYVKASPRFSSGPEIRLGKPLKESYQTTYYPSTTVKEQATGIHAGPGDDVTGIEIHLLREQASSLSISGIVTGVTEQGARVTLRRGGPGGGIVGMTVAGPDGRFSFHDQKPGAYGMYAISGSGEKLLISLVHEFQLAAADVSDVSLVMSPGGVVTGTLAVEGEPKNAASTTRRTVRLEEGQFIQGRPPSGDVAPDGAFRLAGVVPSRYTVKVDPMPDDAYVKELAVDGSPVEGNSIDLSRGARNSTIRIVISRNAGQISGIVQNENGEALTGRLLMVFLMQNLDQEMREENTARVKEDARFKFTGIRPGKYRLFAIDPLNTDGLRGEDALKELAAAVEEFEIKAGDNITKNLTPVSKGGGNAKPKQ